MRISIYTKVMIPAFSIIILFGFAMGFFIVRYQTLILGRELDERATVLIDNLSVNSEYPVLISDRETITRLVKGVLAQKDVVFCQVEDEDGNVFCREGSALVFPFKEFISTIKTKKREGETAEELILGAVEESEEIIGKIYLAVTLSGLNQKLGRVKKTIAMVVVVAVVLTSLVLYFLLARILFRPVAQLVKATGRISKGDINYKVSIRKSDEIGALAASFNKMTEDLKETTVSRDYVDNIIKSMTDTLIVIDNDGKIKTVNQATLNLLGYREDEIIEKPVNMIIAEEEMLMIAGIESFAQTWFVRGVEMAYLSNGGRKIPVLFSGSAMLDGEGELQGIVCVATDITERKKLEEEKQGMQIKLMQSAKLASLGEIAAGVAHEINQPLTYISSFLQNTKDDLEENIKIDKNKLEKRSKVAYGEVKRINSIIQHLRTFGRQVDIDMLPVSIETVLENTLLLMGERIRLRNINLKKNIDHDIPMVLGNANRLEEVFINLFQNATDAFDENTKNGEIGFTVSLSDDNETVIIEVSDNGMGMGKETQEMIFEPFFTTKEVGKGTGLGLSIVYGTIHEHKGTIVCKSELNKGTAFEIRLPVNAGSTV